MISPSSMPQRRPVHPVRPPLEKRAPEWHCPKKSYGTEEAADRALGVIWSRPGRLTGIPMEAHVYKCPRHNGSSVWHLTSQDQEGRAS